MLSLSSTLFSNEFQILVPHGLEQAVWCRQQCEKIKQQRLGVLEIGVDLSCCENDIVYVQVMMPDAGNDDWGDITANM